MNLMKKFGAILGMLAVIASGLQLNAADTTKPKTLTDVYNDSVKLYDAGKYQEALNGFEQVLKSQPKYVYARNYAVKCRKAIAEGKKPTIDLEAQLAGLRIPSVDFNKTDIGTIFEYLTQKTEELSGGKIIANIIYQGTEEERKNTLVSLQLRDVPVTQVIEYVGRLSNIRFKYEQYAVVGTPIRSAGSTATEAAPVEAEGNKPRFDSQP